MILYINIIIIIYMYNNHFELVGDDLFVNFLMD